MRGAFRGFRAPYLHSDPENTHHGLLLVRNDDMVLPGLDSTPTRKDCTVACTSVPNDTGD